MDKLIVGFFVLFFLVSIIGIIVRFYSILKKHEEEIIRLYEDGKLSTDLSNIYVGRLSNAAVRSSVRFHKSLYKVSSDYEQYRNSIKKLELP